MSGPERNAEDPKEALTLQQIVEQLSSVVTQLEDGVATFERDVALSRLGSKRLSDAELAVPTGPPDGSDSKTRIDTRPFDAELDDE